MSVTRATTKPRHKLLPFRHFLGKTNPARASKPLGAKKPINEKQADQESRAPDFANLRYEFMGIEADLSANEKLARMTRFFRGLANTDDSDIILMAWWIGDK